MTKLKVAVIGSNGFIASHLVKRLAHDATLDLHLFGRSKQSIFGNSLPYKTIDFNNETQLAIDFADTDVIYFLISETIPSTSWDDPMIEVERNLIPFLRFMNVISKLNVKKIAFVSSAGTVYGKTDHKVNETSDKLPFSPYGINKLTMEYYLNYYKEKCSLNYDIYRVSNVYGIGQDTSRGLGLINTLLEKIITEHQITVFGDGENMRNYINVEDVAELLFLSTDNNRFAESEIYNISSNDSLTINEIVKIIKGVVDEDFKINYQGKRMSDNSYIDLDNSKVLKAAPDFSFTEVKEGIAKTYNYLKQKLN